MRYYSSRRVKLPMSFPIPSPGRVRSTTTCVVTSAVRVESEGPSPIGVRLDGAEGATLGSSA